MKNFVQIINNFKEVEYLNSLIRLNHDRIACYALANRMLSGSDNVLSTGPVFIEHIAECIINIDELSQEVVKIGGEPSSRCTMLGSFLLTCMEIRVLFSINHVKTTLNCCEQINSMAMNGYTFFHAGISISEKLKSILSNQKRALKSSFNFFKSVKDSFITQS